MSDLDTLAKESCSLAQEIKDLELKRRTISNQLKEMMVSYGFNQKNTEFGQCVQLTPYISPSIGELTKEDKKKIIDWLYINEPDSLTVIHTRLPQIVNERGNELPIELTTNGFSVRVFDRHYQTEPIPLSEIKIKERSKTTRKLKKDTFAKTVPKPTTPVPVAALDKKILGLSRQDRIERTADIIKRWMSGEKKTMIAKHYGLSSPYVGSIVKKHERQLLREMIRSGPKQFTQSKEPPLFEGIVE